ncbi:MAG TPA: ArsA family ATPase, partial [Bacteroidetes bacterium]|nr:ArsA family ATPase [Bacteroidota bacterium]
MDKTTKNIFFLGKGGVGKSTSSALTALHLAESGKKIQLVSLDPAHNQSDIFENKFAEKAIKITDNLTVREVEIDVWVKKYLSDIQFQVKRSYSYLTAFNLENYLDIIKYSPGIEEYALLMAYRSIRQKAKDVDYIIFDMPPTALTLKFLTLPHLSLLWLDNLMALRNKIIEKRQIITKVKL